MDDSALPQTCAPPPSGTDELVATHLPLVRAIASRLYRMRWNSSVDFKEYCQMGALGLVEAAQRFEPARGIQFGSFASWRISGAILNGLARSSEQHQQSASRRRQVDIRVNSLSNDGDQPFDTSMEASLARLSKLAIGLAVGFMLEDTGMYDDALAEMAHRFDGYASIALREMRHRVRKTVHALPSQERVVLERHYFQQHAFTDIADEMGLTRGRVSQIHKAAIQRMRGLLAQDNIGFEA